MDLTDLTEVQAAATVRRVRRTGLMDLTAVQADHLAVQHVGNSARSIVQHQTVPVADHLAAALLQAVAPHPEAVHHTARRRLMVDLTVILPL